MMVSNSGYTKNSVSPEHETHDRAQNSNLSPPVDTRMDLKKAFDGNLSCLTPCSCETILQHVLDCVEPGEI